MKVILELTSDFKTNDLAPDLKIAFGSSRMPLATSTPPAIPWQKVRIRFWLHCSRHQVHRLMSFPVPLTLLVRLCSDLVREVQRHHGLGSTELSFFYFFDFLLIQWFSRLNSNFEINVAISVYSFTRFS